MANNDADMQRHDGENVKCLIGTFRTTQTKLAKAMGIPDSTLSEMLSQDIIDDVNLDKIAKILGNGITKEDIKDYDHEQTKAYIINNFAGGKVYTAGSKDESHDNDYITNELEFIKEYGKTKELLMFYRMQVEPEKVKAEMEGKA